MADWRGRVEIPIEIVQHTACKKWISIKVRKGAGGASLLMSQEEDRSLRYSYLESAMGLEVFVASHCKGWLKDIMTCPTGPSQEEFDTNSTGQIGHARRGARLWKVSGKEENLRIGLHQPRGDNLERAWYFRRNPRHRKVKKVY